MFKKIAVLITAIFLLVITACASPMTVSDINDAWISSESNGTYFETGIDSEVIQIYLVSGDSKGLYWQGTFPLPNQITTDFTVISVADRGALSGSLFGSQDNEKIFTISGDKIKFDFGAMGVTKTVELHKR